MLFFPYSKHSRIYLKNSKSKFHRKINTRETKFRFYIVVAKTHIFTFLILSARKYLWTIMNMSYASYDNFPLQTKKFLSDRKFACRTKNAYSYLNAHMKYRDFCVQNTWKHCVNENYIYLGYYCIFN